MNFNILGFFQKTEYFGGYEDFVDIYFLVHHKIGLYLEVISMHFRVFSEGQDAEWRILLGLLKFKSLFGLLKILDIFLE